MTLLGVTLFILFCVATGFCIQALGPKGDRGGQGHGHGGHGHH